jgi:hypothetical protein
MSISRFEGLGSNPLPHKPNEFILPGSRYFRARKDHLAAVLPDHFQQPTPLGSIKMKVVLVDFCPAVKNQLNVLNRPQVKRDPINGIEAKARRPPLDALRYFIIRLKDSQPEGLNHRLQRVIQSLEERINHRVSI